MTMIMITVCGMHNYVSEKVWDRDKERKHDDNESHGKAKSWTTYKTTVSESASMFTWKLSAFFWLIILLQILSLAF